MTVERDVDLDAELRRLQHGHGSVQVPPASEIVTRSRRLVRRRRWVWSGIAVVGAGVVVAGALGLADAESDTTDVVATGPTTPGSDTTRQPLPEGQEPPGLQFDDLATVAARLERDHPTSFAGLVRSGPRAVRLHIVGADEELNAAARALLGDEFEIEVVPANNSMQAIRELQARVEQDRSEGRLDELHIEGLGIRVGTDGPKVLVTLEMPVSGVEDALSDRYGDDLFVVIPGGLVREPLTVPSR